MANDAVWVPILPSFKEFGPMLKAEGTKAGAAAGQDIAKAMADGVEKSKAAVEKASEAAQKAHDRVADSAGKVRVAEEKLAEVRANPKSSPAKIADAEEKLAAERRKQEQATGAAERADDKLAGAKEKLTKAQKDATAAAEEHTKATGDLKLSQEQAAQASSDLEKAQTALKIGLAAVGAAAVGAAVGLIKVGADFDEAYRTIRVGTGATGEALDDLQESAKSVGATVPNAFGDVASTLADLNTRLGFTGEPLEHLTRQFLELENLTGTAVNIEGVSAALNTFGVDAADAGDVMDDLFQISQATGVGVNELAESALRAAPSLKEFGFGLSESAALAGALDKAGVNADQTLASMNRAMVEFAKSGREPKQALQDTVGEIEHLIGAGNEAAALDMAASLFGTKGAPQFIEAVKTGTLSVSDLMAVTGAGGDTILGLADETRTLSEEWQIFKNQALMKIEPVATAVFNALRDGAKWIMANVVPAVQSLAQWLADNKDILVALGAAIGSALAIYATYRGALVAMTVAKRAWAVAILIANTNMKALNATMRANAIGIVITLIAALVGAIVLAYQRSETFRNVVQTAWQAIQRAIQAAWNIIQPVFTAISDFITRTLIPTITGFWRGTVQPVFKLIGDFIALIWNNVVKPIFQAYRDFIMDVVVPAVKWLWENVVQPVFQALGDFIKWVWENLVKPAWDAMQTALGLLGDAFSWAWNTVIKPVWDALGEGIKWVWENVVQVVFDSIKTAVDLVAQAFDTAVGFIETAWDKVRAAAAKPVKFVIENVYNDGIVKAWNKIAGWIPGVSEIDEYRPSWLGQFHRGGVLPGYTPGKDIYDFISTDGSMGISLSGGEAIMRPEFTRAVGPHAVDGINAAAAHGGADGVREYLADRLDMMHFSQGGVLASLKRIMAAKFPGLQHTSGLRPGDPGYHGRGQALDVSNGYDSTPLMRAAAQYVSDNYPPGPTVELIHNPHSRNIGAGRWVGDGFGFYGAAEMYNHRNHVHWAASRPLPVLEGGWPDRGMEGEIGGGGFFGAVGDLVSGGVNWFRNRAADAWDSIMDPIGERIPDFGAIVGQLPRGFFNLVQDKVRSWLIGHEDGHVGGDGAFDSATVAPGTGPVQDQVRAAMVHRGWDQGAEWAAVDYIVSRESSWNPRAVNPSSGAFGLFQFNPSSGTLQQYLPDRNENPYVQGMAGAKYIADRYGSPTAARRFWEANHWYDMGGLATGAGLMFKEVLRPERVLDPDQTDAFERWMDAGTPAVDLQRMVDRLEPVAKLAESLPSRSASPVLTPGRDSGAQASSNGRPPVNIINPVVGNLAELEAMAQRIRDQEERTEVYASAQLGGMGG